MPHPMALAGVALIAGATLAGACTSARTARRMPSVALRVSAVLLFAVVLADLLPDIWNDLPRSGLPWWAAAGAGAAGFAAAGVLARSGCACASGPTRHAAGRPDGDPGWAAEPAPGMRWGCRPYLGAGWGTVAALAVHRALEGAVVTLAGSATIIAALIVHAAAEGFALAALLRSRRQRLAPALLVSCVSPVAGAVVLASIGVPAYVSVLLTCAVTGVLLRTALTAWRAGQPGSGRAPFTTEPLAVRPGPNDPAAAGPRGSSLELSDERGSS